VGGGALQAYTAPYVDNEYVPVDDGANTEGNIVDVRIPALRAHPWLLVVA